MSHRIKLLIVDDEERFLKTLAQRLSLREIDVQAVTRGEEAVRLAREEPFDLALVDLKMPGMDGGEVLRILKQEHPLMEVIILTGHGTVDSAVEATQAGSYKYLQKPCETDALLQVLKDAYSRRVRRKHKLSEERLDELMRLAQGESPLGILRRLREIERDGA